jgi:hypothetical protein
MKNNRFLVLAIGFLLFISFSIAAPSSQVINFQGYLTDKNGQPVFGTRSMSFALYTAATGNSTITLGTADNTFFGTRQVTVYNGNYSTKLVVGNTTAANIGAASDVWLEVSVGGVVMTPRIQMVGVPFAQNVRGIVMNGANQITSATIASGGTLTNSGTISGGTITNFTNTGTITGGTISGATFSGGAISGTSGTFTSFVQLTAVADSMPGGWNRGIKFTNTDHAAISIGTTPLYLGLHDTDDAFYFYNGSTEYAKINSQGVHSAIWNDLAEVRSLVKGEKKIAGKVYVATKEGIKLSSKRCELGTIGICSDTYGFSLGGKDIPDEQKAHIAISGWVLAYVDKDYPIGTALTSGPNGVLTAMTKKEKRDYPERIVGILDTKPEKYNTVKVDGRYWVKVK